MWSRKYNTHYRDCVGSLIHLLSTRADSCFALHNLEMFSSNRGKVHSESLVHLLIYIRENKNLGLNYYSKIEDASLFDLWIKARIKTENQLMVFYDSTFWDYPDTDRSTGAYIFFIEVDQLIIAHMFQV